MEESTKGGGANKYSHPSQVPSHGFQVTSQLLTAWDFTTSECSGIKTQEEGQGRGRGYDHNQIQFLSRIRALIWRKDQTKAHKYGGKSVIL